MWPVGRLNAELLSTCKTIANYKNATRAIIYIVCPIDLDLYFIVKMSSTATEVLSRKPKNIAIATNPAHELKILEAEVPEPGPDECLLHVRATGICGSDVCYGL